MPLGKHASQHKETFHRRYLPKVLKRKGDRELLAGNVTQGAYITPKPFAL